MTDGNPSSSAYPQQAQASGNLYSFSVHQPYTNWPLHSSHAASYAPSWYSHPAQYNAHKVYHEQSTQTLPPGESENALGKNGKGTGSGEKGPKFVKQWDTAFSTFFKRLGLRQTLSGFHEDMLLLNEDWEREQIPRAVEALIKDLGECKENEKDSTLPKQSLEERKLSYVQSQSGIEAQTPSATIKSVSRLLKQSRKRNDASNRAEFLQSVADKRQRLNDLGESSSTTIIEPESSAQKKITPDRTDADTPMPSCARADAKFLDRDTQIKYDIARNEDGPLRRTMKRPQLEGESPAHSTQASSSAVHNGSREPDAKGNPGLAARLESVEDHLAVRFVPSHPRSLLDRLKFLEDHIIRLEKDFPPWAALHFNQPNRGWPPPPHLSPIIVPSHLASPDDSSRSNATSYASTTLQWRGTSTGAVAAGDTSSPKAGSSSKAKSGQSSLHRAVMEKLEIKRALSDPAASGITSFGSTI